MADPMAEYAPSTVAMTAYNVTQMRGVPMSLDALRTACERHLPGMTAAQFDAAVAGLTQRGYAAVSDNVLVIADSAAPRRFVRKRSVAADGWGDWQVGEPGKPLVPIAEAIG